MFHISKNDLGPTVTLVPRIPVALASEECKVTSRVCFAPTVIQCVMGIAGFGEDLGVTILASFFEMSTRFPCPTVYYTDEDLIKPNPVSDFAITEEHWALHPVFAERIGYIDMETVVKHKRVEIVETPNWVMGQDREWVKYISQEDKDTLIRILSE